MICGHAPWATRSLTAGRLIPLWWHHSRPITMTSTTSPLCSSTYCSVFGGSIKSPLAVRMLMSLLLTWFPATCKRGAGTQSLYVSFQMIKMAIIQTQHIWIRSTCFFVLHTGEYLNPGHLCSVPMVEAPGDAMSKCSGDIQGGGPASRHKTTRKKKETTIKW